MMSTKQLQHKRHWCNASLDIMQRPRRQGVHRPAQPVSHPCTASATSSCLTLRWIALSNSWKRCAPGAHAVVPLAAMVTGNAATQQQQGEERQERQEEPSPEQESLELLEWPAVCRQVG